MSKDHNHILVVDVESTCWDGTPPPGQVSEIIEIGLTVLDLQTLTRSDRTGIMVRPTRSTVSPFCTKLTTITQEMAAAGCSFGEACAILKREYNAKSRAWSSFGDYDRRQFERQCTAEKIGYPFGITHLNVKQLAAIALGLERPQGMAGILKRLQLPLEGTHHRGEDDAWNIAAILIALIKRFRGKV